MEMHNLSGVQYLLRVLVGLMLLIGGLFLPLLFARFMGWELREWQWALMAFGVVPAVIYISHVRDGKVSCHAVIVTIGFGVLSGAIWFIVRYFELEKSRLNISQDNHFWRVAAPTIAGALSLMLAELLHWTWRRFCGGNTKHA